MHCERLHGRKTSFDIHKHKDFILSFQMSAIIQLPNIYSKLFEN